MTAPAEPEVIYEAEQATAEVARILTETAVFHSITDHASLTAASEKRTWLKRRRAEIEAMRVNLKAPVLAAAKNIDDQFRQPLAELNDAVQVIDRAVKAYISEQERQRREEEERLRAEARREQERLEREAAVEAAKAEQLRRQAAEAEAAGKTVEAARLATRAEHAADRAEEKAEAVNHMPVPIVPDAPVKTAGLSTREHWSFRVTDIRSIPSEYLIPNEAAIGAVVRALKGRTNIPGIEVYRDDIVTGRSRQ